MSKEKQDRFDCKHIECNMDGCYCKAGHGYSYGWCVIPYKRKTCKYFEREPKSETIKINEIEVMISKEEKQNLLKEMYEQGRFDAIADLEKEGKVVISKEEYKELYNNDLLNKKLKERKETAREIYEQLQGHGTTYVKKWIKEKYGVDTEE